VEKFIGDAVLALFGAPVAHEDDPERAVRAALAICETIAGLLRDALARIRRGQAQLLTLVGVPGIGKSRLVAELLGVVEAEPELTTWRQGRSLPYGEGVAFWALGEMVKAEAGILETDPAEVAAAKLDRAATSLVEGAEAAWVAAYLRGDRLPWSA
jgi:hypothetical protein